MQFSIQRFDDERFIWLNKYEKESHCEISHDGCQMKFAPAPLKDFWARTFYTPLLNKSDASALVCVLPQQFEATVKIDVEYKPIHQFDQAGLLAYLDNEHWMKCGIEFCLTEFLVYLL